LAFVCVLAGGAGLAEAQAVRTWVSGVGDDVNPCSRTAPCKTFAGAISKTAAKGEINVLDPGGFGAVTITKSISIVAEGATGSILAALVNGVIINAASTDVITLRGLDINGAGSGINGIRFLAGAELHVENCQIYGFTGKGISVESATASQVFVKETDIHTNVGSNGGGILLSRTGAGSVQATIERVRTVGNRFGIRAEDATRATIVGSTASGNNTNGYIANGAAILTLDSSVASDNVNNGVNSGAGAVIRVSNMVVTGNGTGLSGAGAIVSFGNNRVIGNGVDGAPSANALLQ
jgi:hypothetical protein